MGNLRSVVLRVLHGYPDVRRFDIYHSNGVIRCMAHIVAAKSKRFNFALIYGDVRLSNIVVLR
jgi:hypothetical protein